MGIQELIPSRVYVTSAQVSFDHCSMGLEATYTVVIVLPGLSLPPMMMMSPPSRLTAAAWKFVSGRDPLAIVSHD